MSDVQVPLGAAGSQDKVFVKVWCPNPNDPSCPFCQLLLASESRAQGTSPSKEHSDATLELRGVMTEVMFSKIGQQPNFMVVVCVAGPAGQLQYECFGVEHSESLAAETAAARSTQKRASSRAQSKHYKATSMYSLHANWRRCQLAGGQGIRFEKHAQRCQKILKASAEEVLKSVQIEIVK